MKTTILQKTFRKLFAVTLSFTLCLNITACEKQSDESLAAPKNMERLASAAAETAVEENSLEKQKETIPQTYRFEYENNDNTLAISVNAPVHTPEGAGLSTYQAVEGNISQELATNIYNYLFPDGKTYIFTGTDRTKSVIQDDIEELEQWIEEVKADDTLDDDTKQDSIQDMQSIIANYEQEYKNAPKQSTKKKTAVDSTLQKNESPDSGQDYDSMLYCETENGSSLSIYSYPSTSTNYSGIYYNRLASYDKTGIRYSPAYQTAVTEENLETLLAQSSMNLSYDDARKTAESFLEAAGINPSLLQVSLMKGILPSDSGNKYLEQSSISLESEYSAYHFVYNRVLEQAEIACTKQTSYQTDSKNENPASLAWNSETIDIIISDNGIEEIKWLHPLTKIKQLSDNSKLLSFENASAIFEKTAPVIYQNYLTQAKSSDLKQVYKLQVNSIKLSLLKIRDNEDEKSGFLVPAWIFYGTWEQKHDNSDKWKTYDESPYILLAINALDGSVIGPMDGYW